MSNTIEIEVEPDGNMNTRSEFDLATTIVILEKVKNEMVGRAQIESQDGPGADDED